MDYNVSVKQHGRDKEQAQLKLKLISNAEDCGFLFQAVTFALGNPAKLGQFMEMQTAIEEEDNEGSPIGFTG